MKQMYVILLAGVNTHRFKDGCFESSSFKSLQVLILLLLAMPEALSREAVVDIPLAASLFSLPFYLLCLLGSALHVLICTSAGGLCYLCSLPWVLVFTLIILASALMCALVAMAARRMPTSTKTPTKVRLACGVTLRF